MRRNQKVFMHYIFNKIYIFNIEWDTEWKGPQVIVEVSEKAPFTTPITNRTNIVDGKQSFLHFIRISMRNSSYHSDFHHITDGPKIIVRTEEVLIVMAILLLWVGAIALFFNRWGKIRMLEPYQPKFQQQHRSSCPLVELEAIPAHKPSFSRCSMGVSMPSGRIGSISGPTTSNFYTVRGKYYFL